MVKIRWWPPNGLALSRAALISREHGQSDSGCQNAVDLVAALRRRLQRRVGRGVQLLFTIKMHFGYSETIILK